MFSYGNNGYYQSHFQGKSIPLGGLICNASGQLFQSSKTKSYIYLNGGILKSCLLNSQLSNIFRISKKLELELYPTCCFLCSSSNKKACFSANAHISTSLRFLWEPERQLSVIGFFIQKVGCIPPCCILQFLLFINKRSEPSFYIYSLCYYLMVCQNTLF